MLYRTNWSFFFFQLLGMSTPRCAAFRRGRSVQSRELIWMEVCPPCHLRLPAQPGFMVGLPRTSPIASCGVLFSSSASIISGISTSALSQQSHGFSPCRQSLHSWRETEMRPWGLHFPPPSAHHMFSWLPWYSLWVSGEASEENPTEVWSQPLVCDSRDPPILRLAHCQLWEISNHRI